MQISWSHELDCQMIERRNEDMESRKLEMASTTGEEGVVAKIL